MCQADAIFAVCVYIAAAYVRLFGHSDIGEHCKLYRPFIIAAASFECNFIRTLLNTDCAEDKKAWQEVLIRGVEVIKSLYGARPSPLHLARIHEAKLTSLYTHPKQPEE